MSKYQKKVFSQTGWLKVIDRMSKYEYWPWYLFFLPLFPVWLVYALRTGRPTYFTVVNPSIPMGGLFGESKSEILSYIPDRYKPRGIKVTSGERGELLSLMSTYSINFPVIIKPDVGERGKGVRKIKDAASMYRYLSEMNDDVIVQEFIELPIELGVLYHRFPGQAKGKVTSVTIKEFLTVTGDGIHTVHQLMGQQTRSRTQIKRLQQNGEDLERIPEEGENVLLEPIGNHCLGTTFLDGHDWICDELNQVFDQATENFTGFHYGRFDLKIKDRPSLLNGQMKVFEVNGVTSEPGHIYDPRHSLWKAYKDTAEHMGIVYRISKANLQNGIAHTPLREVIRSLYHHFNGKNKTPEKAPGFHPTYLNKSNRRILPN